jgi:dihydrolipoamide dehydrogenase
VAGVRPAPSGKPGVRVTLKPKTGDVREESFSKILVAIGRRSVLEEIGLERAGLAPDRGRVPVDDRGRTRVPGVFAIGDIVPGPQLAHLASMEGIVAAETIAGREPVPINRNAVPACTYTDPEAACVGLTEGQAVQAGYEVTVSRFPFLASGKALIEGDQTGWVKLVADTKTGQVLGAHIVGPQATELIAEATLAVQLESTGEELARTIHAHPTLSEAVGEAAHAAAEGAIHFFARR